MAQRIDSDNKRFHEIVRGKIKKNLKKYMSTNDMFKKKDGKTVSVPIHSINLPKFKFGSPSQGVGSGEGEVGDTVGKNGQPSSSSGKAGDKEGSHSLEVDVELEELARILGEDLELPRIEPKGQKSLKTVKDKYSSLRKTGPESLRNFKKTFFNALKRQISSGEYNSDDPIIVPQRPDKRYRSWKEIREPESSAVIFFVMDVSGSMGQEQKEIVRLASFWIQLWLRSQFDNIEIVYVIHDAKAREVDEETFFHTRESGGTMISSAYKECLNIIDERYSPDDWNIYLFQFSDGDNWSKEDNDRCLDLIKRKFLPILNLFCYGQCKSAYGSGEYLGVLSQAFSDEQKMTLANINDRDEIYEAIKVFLQKGV